jgi:hypothetical protein
MIDRPRDNPTSNATPHSGQAPPTGHRGGQKYARQKADKARGHERHGAEVRFLDTDKRTEQSSKPKDNSLCNS